MLYHCYCWWCCCCCCCCRYFSWGNLAMALGVHCATGMGGITLCYHRMLTHRCAAAHMLVS
jgi:fatty-acid desaturase